MKQFITLLLWQAPGVLCAQTQEPFNPSLALGTRITISPVPSPDNMGSGMGGQFRLWLTPRINTEWYLDYLVQNTSVSSRKNINIGWSVLLYGKNNCRFDKPVQPYLAIGHCFDRTTIFENANPKNKASRLSMSTHTGIGAHFNILPRFDCSLTALYMFHLGKELLTKTEENKLWMYASSHNRLYGHLMLNISFNYRFSGL